MFHLGQTARQKNDFHVTYYLFNNPISKFTKQQSCCTRNNSSFYGVLQSRYLLPSC